MQFLRKLNNTQVQAIVSIIALSLAIYIIDMVKKDKGFSKIVPKASADTPHTEGIECGESMECAECAECESCECECGESCG